MLNLKQSIKDNLGKLTIDQKRKIVSIVQDYIQQAKEQTTAFTFNLDELPYRCLHQLNQYIDECQE